MSVSITRSQLAEVIGDRTLHVTNPAKLARAIAGYLASEHRKIDVDSLTRDVMQYRLEHGLVEAVAVSAHELTPVVMKDIKALLKEHFPHAKHIMVDSRIDESVVGGVRIELPRETLDLSIRARLNQFKRLVAAEAK